MENAQNVAGTWEGMRLPRRHAEKPKILDTSQYFDAQGDEAPLASSPPKLGLRTLDGKINKGEKVKKLGEPSKSKDMVHRARKPPDEPSSPSSSSSDDENDDDKRRDKKKKGRGREPSSSDGSDNDKVYPQIVIVSEAAKLGVELLPLNSLCLQIRFIIMQSTN